MPLFRILVLHASPKDTHKATETYLSAADDEEVAQWINKTKKYDSWFDTDRTVYHEDQDIPFREYVMLNKGDLEDDYGYEDAYYGVTKWGWEPVPAATDEDIRRIIEIGIAVSAQ